EFSDIGHAEKDQSCKGCTPLRQLLRAVTSLRFFVMLTVSQVSKSFAGRVLFEDVSLQVNRGDRIGLVGPNGVGKSALFSLILGDASPDSGPFSIETSANVGFLPQEIATPLPPTLR